MAVDVIGEPRSATSTNILFMHRASQVNTDLYSHLFSNSNFDELRKRPMSASICGHLILSLRADVRSLADLVASSKY